jgi:uncharacterized cupin superfamily protein
MSRDRDPNIYDVGTELRSFDGYHSARQRVGDAAGSRKLGASVFDIEPGQAAYPFHFHYVEEELITVLEGTPLVRDAGGWRRVERGAVLSFLPGAGGGHQVMNDTPEVVRILSISTHGEPDIVSYPDQNKLAAVERPVGPGKLMKIFNADEGADSMADFMAELAPPEYPEAL